MCEIEYCCTWMKTQNAQLSRSLCYIFTFLCLSLIHLLKQEGILCAHACIRWTTIAWAHQIWWREIEHTRKVTVLLKAISLVLWIWFFPAKNVLCDKKRTFSTRVFSCRFFSNRFSWPFKDLKRLNAKNHCSCIRSEFHWQSNAF